MREVVVSSFAFGQVQSHPEQPFNPPIHLAMRNEHFRREGKKKTERHEAVI